MGQLTDYMPLPTIQSMSTSIVYPWIVRHIESIRGSITFRIECVPAFDYAQSSHSIQIKTSSLPEINEKNQIESLNLMGDRVIFSSEHLVLDLRAVFLTTPTRENGHHLVHEDQLIEWHIITNDEKLLGPGVCADVTLQEGQELILILREEPELSPNWCHAESICHPQTITKNLRDFNPNLTETFLGNLKKDTLSYWAEWLRSCTYQGRWRETVLRSALTLKLLTYAPTGAIIASPTFGLPETVGGVRNWDYRYSWVRDASFTIYALLRV